jgi:hypothetical protein
LVNVFSVLWENKLKINIEKSHFFRFKVEALGRKVTNRGMMPLENKVEAINNLDTPKNINKLCSFLGMVEYYWNFIDKY